LPRNGEAGRRAPSVAGIQRAAVVSRTDQRRDAS
jgi:hypothetical protein